VANTHRKIIRLIDIYVYDPSILRNKIAHGQWKIALNSNNTKVNPAITSRVQSITIVDLYRYKKAFQSLFRIVEDIIESPNKAHHRDYWVHITNFEETQKKMGHWTIENKVNALKEKRQRARIRKGTVN
jgi:molybdenum cofactor biosynthesis enzyme MoaA